MSPAKAFVNPGAKQRERKEGKCRHGDIAEGITFALFSPSLRA